MTASALRALVLCAVLTVGCASQGEPPASEDSAGVVVRLPVQRSDSAAGSAAATPSSGRGRTDSAAGRDRTDAIAMEVPAVPLASAPRVDTALDGLDYLRARRLMVPVEGVEPSALRDTFGEERGGGTRTHGALDILAPRGTPVLAADDGRVEKLHESEGGGLTLYQFDPSGRFVYYYAHLDGYREGLAEGEVLTRGAVLGYVGTTGNAPPGTPHLHFAIGRLDAERRWWKYAAINPLGLLVEPGRMSAAARR